MCPEKPTIWEQYGTMATSSTKGEMHPLPLASLSTLSVLPEIHRALSLYIPNVYLLEGVKISHKHVALMRDFTSGFSAAVAGLEVFADSSVLQGWFS